MKINYIKWNKFTLNKNNSGWNNEMFVLSPITRTKLVPNSTLMEIKLYLTIKKLKFHILNIYWKYSHSLVYKVTRKLNVGSILHVWSYN